ncbi:MAG TPA: MBL fold metallo-hydrolase [Euzebya sp.]|nr:MBL fold metallo-hydrolase [Euzebya sp.]
MWSDPEVQTVLPGVHRAPVPLPDDGLRAVNVYVIEDGDGVTLVDAGWDGPVARAAVQRGLDAAGADITDVRRILITHVHYDHIGQATALRREGAQAYWLGEGEKATFTNLITDPLASRLRRMEELLRYGAEPLVRTGLTQADAPEDPLDWDHPDRWAIEGDHAPLLDGALEIINTPGHTIGHQCYVHRGRRVLFAGDHVLPHITPSIGLEGVVNRQSLADFLSSLAKVRNLDVDLVLPAHGEVFTDLSGRVDQLTTHHDQRLAACAAAVGAATTTAYAVAMQLPWTRRETPFDQLNHFNQVLATWETAAHLELLHARGTLRRVVTDDIITFGPVAG